MSTVLLVGEDELILESRAAVLRTAGAETICCRAASALSIQARCECDLVVLCHSLSQPFVATLAEAIRSHWPRTRILLVTAARAWESEGTVPAVDAISTADPEQLIRRTVELLGRRPPRNVQSGKPPESSSGRIPA